MRLDPDFIPAIIDIEASGFGCESYPIEAGVIDARGNKYCSLIRPESHWNHWTAEAEMLHGVRRELLFSHGLNVNEISRQLNQLLAGTTVYCDGWVVDYPWLIKLFDAARQRMLFTCSPLESILTESQMAIWHKQKDVLTEKMNGKRHRASSDAELIQQVYLHTRAMTKIVS